MTPTVATVLGVAVLVFIVVWVAVWRKARKTGEAENPWEGAFDVPLVAETSSEDTPCEKPTTIVEDAPTPTVETDITVSVVNDAVPSETPAETPTETPAAPSTDEVAPFENCKTVEVAPKPIEEVELVAVTKPEKVKKPRKTTLERTEEAIAKLEGQIGRRSTLLKQLKKPIMKDERLNKWKTKLRELKAARKELVKAAKKDAGKKALYDRFGVPYPEKSSTK